MKVIGREMLAQTPHLLTEMLVLVLARQLTGAVVRAAHMLSTRVTMLRYWRPAPLSQWARQREW